MSEQNENEVRPEVMQAAKDSIEKNAELLHLLASDDVVNDQLQAELEAAVEAEPEDTQLTQVLTDVANYVQPEPVNDPAVDADVVVESPTPPFEFAQEINSTTVDTNKVEWTNAGKKSVPIPNTFKSRAGASVIVYAQKITAYGFDKISGESYVVLADESRQQRPQLHGYAPKVGDYFVSVLPITNLSNGGIYFEAPETAIVGPDLFKSLYEPVTE